MMRGVRVGCALFLAGCCSGCVSWAGVASLAKSGAPARKCTEGTQAIPRTGGLHFLGWTHHEAVRLLVARRFAPFGFSVQAPGAPSQSPVIEVILEEKDSTPGWIKIMNLIGTIASGTLLPFYNQVNQTLRFRLVDSGTPRTETQWQLRHNELFGVLLIPLAPFLWPTRSEEGALLKSTDRFISSCLGR